MSTDHVITYIKEKSTYLAEGEIGDIVQRALNDLTALWEKQALLQEKPVPLSKVAEDLSEFVAQIEKMNKFANDYFGMAQRDYVEAADSGTDSQGLILAVKSGADVGKLGNVPLDLALQRKEDQPALVRQILQDMEGPDHLATFDSMVALGYPLREAVAATRALGKIKKQDNHVPLPELFSF